MLTRNRYSTLFPILIGLLLGCSFGQKVEAGLGKTAIKNIVSLGKNIARPFGCSNGKAACVWGGAALATGISALLLEKLAISGPRIVLEDICETCKPNNIIEGLLQMPILFFIGGGLATLSILLHLGYVVLGVTSGGCLILCAANVCDTLGC